MTGKDKNDKTNLLNSIHAYLYARKKTVTLVSWIATGAGLLLLCSGNTEAGIIGGVLFFVSMVPFLFIGQKWQ